jgi:PAS domain S-box-containing protein
LSKRQSTVKQGNDECKYLFDNTSDAIRVINSDFTIRRINQSFADMTGVNKGKIVGRKCWEVFPGPLCHTQKCRLQRILDGEKQIQVEIERQKKDGSTISCIVTTSRLQDDTGKLTGIIEEFKDITEHRYLEEHVKESEELYEDLFQQVPIAIMEYDFSHVRGLYDQLRNDGITDFRKYFFITAPRELYKYKALLKKINQQALSLWEISITEDIDAAVGNRIKYFKSYDGLKECQVGLAEGKIHFDYEDVFQTNKGDTRYLHTWVSVAPGCENSLSKVYVCFVDITERKKAEDDLKLYQDNLQHIINERTQELRETNKRLYEQINQRIEFTRALAHELKTPLTPIFSTSDYMVTHMEEGPWLDAVKNINRGAARLNKRINELFDLTRFETGNLTIRLAEEDPFPIFTEVAADVSPMIDENEQHFIFDVPQTLPVLMIDRERIYQVLLNLIENAIKFTPRGGKITLCAAADKNSLKVEVKNEGEDIPLKTRKKLFKPYYKSEDDRSSLSGLGLGLALCKSFIELHNGNIWVKRRPPNENVFGFSIPLAV